MSFKIERTVSVGTLITIFFVVVGGIGMYFTVVNDVADAGEAAVRAEKLSAQNTAQIHDLNKAVHEITTAIVKQNETVKWQYQIHKNRIDNLKERINRQ